MINKLWCFIVGHDWHIYEDALDWNTLEPAPYKLCWRCEKLEGWRKVN